MMPATVAALSAGEKVAVATLLELQFLSSTQRFHDGVGWLTAGGRDWLGFGEFVSMSGLEQSSGMSAPQATFTLSGASPELMAIASVSATEVTGRPVSVSLQFLSGAGVPLDDPVAVWVGRMDVMSFAAGSGSQAITLTAEQLFVSRIRAPYGYMTDADQQARFPGDRGYEFMPGLRNKTVNWLRA